LEHIDLPLLFFWLSSQKLGIFHRLEVQKYDHTPECMADHRPGLHSDFVLALVKSETITKCGDFRTFFKSELYFVSSSD
jgi:hypothetical protein